MGITQENEFDRVFVFGDGALYAAALEDVLKFKEFSDGDVYCDLKRPLSRRNKATKTV